MADPRKKTISYHRAEYYIAQKSSINLGMCIKQATDRLVTVSQRSISRAGGRIMRLAHFHPDDQKGYFLHLTVDTPGEHTSIVPKFSEEDVEVKVGTLAPPNDSEYMDGDAFLYVRGDDICLCVTTVKTQSIVLFLREFFIFAAIRKDAKDFNFRHAVDTAKLAIIQRSGVKHITLKGTLFEASLNHQKRKDKARGLLGVLSSHIRALSGTPHAVADDALRVELTLTVDKRHKGGITLGYSRLKAIAEDLVQGDDDVDDYLIITNNGEEIKSSEIVLRTHVGIDSMGKSVQRDAAWTALADYYDTLSKNGSLVR